MPPPRIGQTIFVPETDIVHRTFLTGGAATVSAVWTADDGATWVAVAEVQGAAWLWSPGGLCDEQDLHEHTGPAGIYATHIDGRLYDLTRHCYLNPDSHEE